MCLSILQKGKNVVITLPMRELPDDGVDESILEEAVIYQQDIKLKGSHSVGTIEGLLRLKDLSASLQRGLFIQRMKLGHGGFWETYQ
jgi:hypothetical protein